MEIVWQTEKDLKTFVERFVKRIKPGMAFGLSGPLGAGKTTFVRYLAKSLSSIDQVSSPSYVLEQRYRLPDQCELAHWDLYRITDVPDELLEPPMSNEIRVVEWVDKFPELLTNIDIHIQISLAEVGKHLIRNVTVSY